MATSITAQHRTPGPAAGQGPLPVTQDAPRTRRRPVVIGAGLALAAIGALVSVWMVNQAGDKISVIATAHAIEAGETIKASDLVTARISDDPVLHPVPASRSSDIVGKTASSDLPAGVLLTDASVGSAPSVTQGKSVVGILAKPGQLPDETVHPGDQVTVVHTPQDDSGSSPSSGPGSEPASLPAVVAQVGAPDANGAVVVDVAAADADSTTLAAWAAGGNVALVLKAQN